MKQRKKQSIYRFMQKSLRKEYFYLKRELLLYCPVDFGTVSANAYYAAFDKDGISIYEYDRRAENRIRLLERYPWKTWKQVKIDHFLQKSEFVFQGQTNRIFQFLKNGQEAQAIIDSYTSIEITEIPRPLWCKIPGYRSKKPISMYVASLLYTILLAATLKALVPYVVEKALYAFSIFTMLTSTLCLCIGLIEPSIVLLSQDKTRAKVIYYYTYFIACGFISIFIFW
ncbi:hypothetical protein P6P90_01825 [Ectobacillus antri]|jgi:hypothetical protein|uniref:DUF2812 domain-containing protein n=1 Tax=Ectobacillus antri TaxID=2486280 RepID=A0ABT6H0U9_9BACI|nr:hypothetical protein [Ectobacillus antri]MDG4656064.1 hypothetical protein [Ectobacillus antri]MDG5752739.1 hypothetical protein [Ectobacillus antri]